MCEGIFFLVCTIHTFTLLLEFIFTGFHTPTVSLNGWHVRSKTTLLHKHSQITYNLE